MTNTKNEYIIQIQGKGKKFILFPLKVLSCHIRVKSEYILCNYLTLLHVKEVLACNRHDFSNSSDCKRLNEASLATWLTVRS